MKSVKCRHCKEKVSGKDKAGWIFIGKDGMAFVTASTSMDKQYCQIISNKWFCSVECLDDYIWKMFNVSRRKSRRLLREIQKEMDKK